MKVADEYGFVLCIFPLSVPICSVIITLSHKVTMYCVFTIPFLPLNNKVHLYLFNMQTVLKYFPV